jgi:sugar phosphate isomerase/epimerase
MKFGMHSCGLKSYPLIEALRKAGEFGYDGFEIDVFPPANTKAAWEKYRNELTNTIPELLRIKDTAGIEICSLCLGVLWFVNIAGEYERERDLGISIIKDCVEIGSCLGARCLLLPIGQPAEVSPVQARDRLYHSITRCIHLAESKGIVLAVENVVQPVLWNSTDLIELVDRVGSSHCKVYYDVGNPYFAQINPAEEILQLKNRIFQLHVKDMQTVKTLPADAISEAQAEPEENAIRFRGDTTNWRGKKDASIGTGIVNWLAIMNAILGIEFDGYLVTEIQQDVNQPDMIAEENLPALKRLEQIIRM